MADEPLVQAIKELAALYADKPTPKPNPMGFAMISLAISSLVMGIALRSFFTVFAAIAAVEFVLALVLLTKKPAAPTKPTLPKEQTDLLQQLHTQVSKENFAPYVRYNRDFFDAETVGLLNPPARAWLNARRSLSTNASLADLQLEADTAIVDLLAEAKRADLALEHSILAKSAQRVTDVLESLSHEAEHSLREASMSSGTSSQALNSLEERLKDIQDRRQAQKEIDEHLGQG